MNTIVDIQSFLKFSGPIIDVRSPGEFVQGHIPGSVNIPLFSNDERVLVGTVYKRSGYEAAVILGLEIVGPKLAYFVKEAKALNVEEHLKIYCWRGGMRSSSMAWLLQTAGLKTYTLQNGYKAFRSWALHVIKEPHCVSIIGGLTGCGKTEILQVLRERGQQVLDLEDLAKHRGSSFGLIDKIVQPSNEQFENEIALQWAKFDKQRPVWIEDESRMIGKCKIPDPLFIQMHKAPLYVIRSSKEARIQRLLQDYGKTSIPNLILATKRIEKKLGSERTRQVISHLQEKNFEKAIEILLYYYDISYIRCLKSCQKPVVYLSVENKRG
jgi:tRNA 2-selenouridine synthase